MEPEEYVPPYRDYAPDPPEDLGMSQQEFDRITRAFEDAYLEDQARRRQERWERQRLVWARERRERERQEEVRNPWHALEQRFGRLPRLDWLEQATYDGLANWTSRRLRWVQQVYRGMPEQDIPDKIRWQIERSRRDRARQLTFAYLYAAVSETQCHTKV